MPLTPNEERLMGYVCPVCPDARGCGTWKQAMAIEPESTTPMLVPIADRATTHRGKAVAHSTAVPEMVRLASMASMWVVTRIMARRSRLDAMLCHLGRMGEMEWGETRTWSGETVDPRYSGGSVEWDGNMWTGFSTASPGPRGDAHGEHAIPFAFAGISWS